MSPTLLLAAYRRRDEVFGALPEAQWRILLDLYCNGDCSVSAAGYASGVPDTTSLRHVGSLVDASLIWRREDPFDGRRSFLSLTDRARRLFSEFEKPARRPSARASSGVGSPISLPGSAATLSPVN